MLIDAHVETDKCIETGKMLGFDAVVVFGESSEIKENNRAFPGIIIEAESGTELRRAVRRISGKKKL